MSTPPELDLARWLDAIGMSQYSPAFQAHDIENDVLGSLTSDDLREIGVVSLGHRKRILAAIADLSPDAQHENARVAAEPLAERRRLTVMFCDLADSTELSVGVDPEEFGDYIRLFRQVIEDAARPFDAYVAQYVGDGLLAYFGYPQSTGHDAEKAVEAGFAIVAAVARMPAFGGRRPHVRIGISTGLAVVGGVERSREAMGDSVLGETVNLAARLQSLADLDSIVISPETRDLLGTLFTYRDLGRHDLKGFEQKIEVCQVEARSTFASRFDALRHGQTASSFVGRHDEIQRLQEIWSKAQSGLPQFVVIQGEAGMGKSRLAREALASRPEHKDRTLIVQCSPYQRASPFYPVRYLIARAAGIDTSDAAQASLTKLRDFIASMSEIDEQSFAIVCELLELEPPEPQALSGLSAVHKREMAMGFLTLLLRIAVEDRQLLVLEDIHWMDPSTAELLRRVFTSISGKPICVVASMRPGDLPDWAAACQPQTMHLDRLTPQETARMIKAMTRSSQADQIDVNGIVERSDGIPIFIEELVRYQLELLTTPGANKAGQPVPATLSELIHARIDRLAAGRRIAATSAAIGREFPVSILRAVSEEPDEIINDGISELVDAGILAYGYSPFGAAVRFRQMLVRDAVYESLLRRDRKALHNRIIAEMQQSYPTVVESSPHVIALQLEQAGDMEDATQEWENAGILAVRASAYGEAVAHLRQGLRTNAMSPPGADRDKREMSLRVTLVGALIPAVGYYGTGVAEEVDRINSLAASGVSGDSAVLAMVPKWVMLGVGGNVHGSKELALKIKDMARNGSRVDRLIAHRVCGTSHLFTAELATAIREYHAFMEMYVPDEDSEALRTLHGDHALMVQLGLSEAYTLIRDEAAARFWRDAVLSAAERSKRVHDHAHVLAFAGCLHAALVGDMSDCGQHAEALIQIAETHDLPFWQGHGRLFKGLHDVDCGRVDAGLALARRGIDEIRAADAFSNCWYILMAGACARHGHLADARRMLGYARRSMAQGDLRFSPEYHRVMAELLQAEGAGKEMVNAELSNALALAEKLGTRLFLDHIDRDLSEHALT